MRMDRLLALAAIIICLLAAPALALHENEAWRSEFGAGRSVSLDSTNGSVWAALGSRVYHFAADGTVLSKTLLWIPDEVAASTSDGACWVIDIGALSAYDDLALVRLAPDGAPSVTVRPGIGLQSLSVDQRDGSCWVVNRNGEAWHVATSGAVLAQFTVADASSVAVDSADGTLWFGVAAEAFVAHYTADGTLLWQGGTTEPYVGANTDIAVNSADRSVWATDPGGLRVAHFAADGTDLGTISAELSAAGDQDLSVDPADGSLWLGGGVRAYHFAANGDLLWTQPIASGDYTMPGPHVAANPNDHSCWVTHGIGGLPFLEHYATDGTPLWHLDNPFGVPYAAAGAADGSAWIADAGLDRLERLAPDGQVLTRTNSASHLMGPSYAFLNPHNDTVLTEDLGYHIWTSSLEGVIADSTMVRYASDGSEVWRSGSSVELNAVQTMAMNPADGSYWIYHRAFVDPATSEEYLPAVIHYAANGTELARRESADYLIAWGFAVNPLDGSCWLSTEIDGASSEGELIHIAADGTEIRRVGADVFGADLHTTVYVAVNPADGSVWTSAIYGMDRPDELAKLSAAGDLLWSKPIGGVPDGIAIDPVTGFAWVTHDTAMRIVSNTGVVLWYAEGFYNGFARDCTSSVNPADGSCWVPDMQHGEVVHLVVPLTQFNDIPADQWALPEIDWCADAGIVQGYDDKTYHPEYTVSRDQMAVYIARAVAGSEAAVPTGPMTATFEDVPVTGYGESGTDPYWAYKYIEYCVDQGVVEGYDPTRYGPEGVVTRDQMAVFVARAKGWVHIGDDMTSAPQLFSDVPAGHWAGTAIKACVDNGVVQGYEDGSYAPGNAVTRDQMAVYIERAFDLPL